MKVPTDTPGSTRGVLASLALCMLLPALGTSIANVALPTLAGAFGASFQQAQWVVLAYLLAITSLVVGVGRWGDLLGRRRLQLAGIALFTAASALAGAAPTLGLLVAARAAQGLGAAVMMALTLAFVADTIPKAGTGRAMGLLGSVTAVGTALGPSLGGLLIARAGWPAIFLVNVPLGLAALALAWRHLPGDRPAPAADRRRIDLPGTVVLALALAAYALAMTLGHGRFGPLNAALLLAAVAGAGLFVWVEARAPSPLVRGSTVRDPVFQGRLAQSTLVSTVVMSTLVVGPFHLARGLGLDAAQVGAAMSVGPAVAALAGVPSGRVVDRFGARRMALLGLAGLVAGCLGLCLAPAGSGVAGYVLPMAVLTGGYALFQAANNTAVMADVATDQRGVVSGLLNLSRHFGFVTGASVMGAVYAATSMQVAFAVAAALAAIALAIVTGTGSGTAIPPAARPSRG